MKPWTKFESSLIRDSRIMALIADHGMKGFGLYAMLRIYVECSTGFDQDCLESICIGYSSRKIISEVLNKYDLFATDGDGIVCVRECVRESVRECVREPARAPEPTRDEETEKRDIDRIREWLTSPSNLIWREPMMMQSGYASLLQSYWKDAVEFFIQHTLSQDNLKAMFNEHEARQYFSNFCRLSVGSGQRLKEHLLELSQQSSIRSSSAGLRGMNHESSSINQDGVQYFNGRPLPPDAPPRPSDTAEWDDSTGTWFELYH